MPEQEGPNPEEIGKEKEIIYAKNLIEKTINNLNDIEDLDSLSDEERLRLVESLSMFNERLDEINKEK